MVHGTGSRMHDAGRCGSGRGQGREIRSSACRGREPGWTRASTACFALRSAMASCSCCTSPACACAFSSAAPSAAPCSCEARATSAFAAARASSTSCVRCRFSDMTAAKFFCSTANCSSSCCMRRLLMATLVWKALAPGEALTRQQPTKFALPPAEAGKLSARVWATERRYPHV